MKKLIFLSVFLPFSGMAQVGVGTTSPQAKLHVQGDLRVDSVAEQTSGTMNVAIDMATGLFVKQNGTTKASGFVNAGVPITLGDISVQMATGGNRSLMIRMASTATLSGTSVNNFLGSGAPAGGSTSNINGHVRNSDVFNGGTFFRWQASGNFPHHGATQTILISDETNLEFYRITIIVGSGYFNNFISIEKL